MILKLKRTPGIYVVGFMASGKSTIGRLLAERLGWPFADLDDDIEAAAGRTISDIFELRGEAEFRNMETAALQRRVRAVESGHPLVLALGGGAFAQSNNYQLIENNGVSIWLNCPFEVVKRRVAEATHRPLARDPERFQQLFEARQSAYRRANHCVPIESDTPEVTVDAILQLPVFK